MSLAGCALIRACRLRRDPGYGSQLGLSRYSKVETTEKLAPPSSPRSAPARTYAATRGVPAITRARAEMTVAFPSVAVINTTTLGVRQTADLFKLGVNYKFERIDLSAIAAAN